MTIRFAAPPGAWVNEFVRFWHRWLLCGQKILLDAWASLRHIDIAAASRGVQFADARGRPSGHRTMEEPGRRNHQRAARSTVKDHVQEVAVTSISDRYACVCHHPMRTGQPAQNRVVLPPFGRYPCILEDAPAGHRQPSQCTEKSTWWMKILLYSTI